MRLVATIRRATLNLDGSAILPDNINWYRLDFTNPDFADASLLATSLDDAFASLDEVKELVATLGITP